MFIVGVILFATAVLISVAWHECGHMWVAQATGMKVRRYFVGFGPKIWSTHKKGTEYGVKALPLGGFCDIAGMYAIDDVAPEDEPRAMYRQKVWKRVAVLLAGPAMNFILAFAAIVAVACVSGLPDQKHLIIAHTACSPEKQLSPVKLSSCSGPSPAEKAGLRPGDMIVGVNGHENLGREQAREAIAQAPGTGVELTIIRNGTTLHVHSGLQKVERFVIDRATGTYAKDSEGHYRTTHVSTIGVYLDYKHKVTLSQVLPASVTFTAELGQKTWEGLISMPRKVGALFHALTGHERDPSTPTSLYGAAVIGGDLADQGQWYSFAMLIISINYFLGLFNLLPLLPLDGGHIMVAVYEKIRDMIRRLRGLGPGNPVDFTKLTPLTFIFLIIGGAYMILVLMTDIINPINIR